MLLWKHVEQLGSPKASVEIPKKAKLEKQPISYLMRNNIAAHDVRISSHLAPTQKKGYRSLHQVQVGIQRSAKTLQDEHANDDTAHRRIDLDAMASTQVQHLSEERTNADRAQRQACIWWEGG